MDYIDLTSDSNPIKKLSSSSSQRTKRRKLDEENVVIGAGDCQEKESDVVICHHSLEGSADKDDLLIVTEPESRAEAQGYLAIAFLCESSVHFYI